MLALIVVALPFSRNVYLNGGEKKFKKDSSWEMEDSIFGRGEIVFSDEREEDKRRVKEEEVIQGFADTVTP